MRRDDSAFPLPIPTQVLRDRISELVRRANRRRLLASLICTAALTLAIFGGFFGVARVSGNSMRPSFQNKDLILFIRMGGCGRYDVVALKTDGVKGSGLVKRIIGLPGDTVDIDKDGRVSINGVILEEPYAIGMTRKNSEMQYPVALGKDEYFVLGDNRQDSMDSRGFGTITGKQITGKIMAVLRIGKESERW